MLRVLHLVITALYFSSLVKAAEPIPLTVVSFSAPDSAHGRRWDKFKEKIDATLGDRIELSMLTGGQVGNEDNMLSSLRRNRAQMGIISIGALSAIVPELSILSAPFLFESDDEADFVMDNFLFEPYRALLASRGLTLLKWEDGGWHNIYARDPLLKPTDISKYRLRSSATNATRLFLAALGADVVVLDFGDMVAALETGLVDGGVTTSIIYRVSGLYQDASHFTLTRHAFSPGALLANSSWVARTPSGVFETVLAAHGTAEEGRSAVRAELAESEILAREAGANIYNLSVSARREWAEAAKNSHDELISVIGGSAQQIYGLALAGKKAYSKRSD